jgi:hypothetical protein
LRDCGTFGPSRTLHLNGYGESLESPGLAQCSLMRAAQEYDESDRNNRVLVKAGRTDARELTRINLISKGWFAIIDLENPTLTK